MKSTFFHITEAKRYLANAKETLRKSPIEYGRYTDAKYVKEAAGIAYLAALKAIDAYLLSRGMIEKELPHSIEEYREMVRTKMPHNGKLLAALQNVYENLHILAYYRGGTEIKMIKSGLENCKKIIELVERTIGGREAGLYKVSEPKATYRKVRKSVK